MRRVALLLAFACLLGLTGSAGAITPPTGFIDTTLVTGLSAPTSMVWDPASARLFITEQSGNLRVVKDGALLDAPFVHLNVDSSGERGLLGVAFDPNFATNHFVYVYYTASVPRAQPCQPVHRATATSPRPAARQVAARPRRPLERDEPQRRRASTSAPTASSTSRVGDNADRRELAVADEPAREDAAHQRRRHDPDRQPVLHPPPARTALIWALGLRNPFTFAVPARHRAHLHQRRRPDRPGRRSTTASPARTTAGPTSEGPGPNPAYTDPLFYYAHSGNPTPNGCAITGGTFYNPPVAYFPAQYVGRYFFSDLCGGWIEQLDPGNGNAVSDFASGASAPVDLDTGPDGSLYYLENGGRVGRISYEDDPTVNDAHRPPGRSGRR